MPMSIIRTTLAVAIAVALISIDAAAQQSHAPTSATTTRSMAGVPQLEGGFPLLFDQSGSPNFQGVLAMTNLDPGDEIYDTEFADDFVVPSGGWAISVVRLGSFYHSGGTPVRPSTSGNITIYYDSGTGRPGAAVPGCSHKDIPLFYNQQFLTSVLPLPNVCGLPAGNYWMGFSGNLSFADQNGGVYVTQETTSPNGVPMWRNPRGGYGTGCGDWGVLTSCGLASNGGMTFQLYGQTTPVSLQSFSIE